MKLFVPGRICLFGEHSDWAGGYRRVNAELEKGYTLICGTNQGLYANVKSHPNQLIVKTTLDDGTQKGPFELPMEKELLLEEAMRGGFLSYIAGVAYQILTHYHVRGLEIDNYLTDLPVKKGLSSSAAVCVLVARAFNRIYDLKMTVRGEMEFAYLGEITTPSRCGRMDQGCAYGNRPIMMTYDGDHIQVDEISVPQNLYYVIVDLKASKDTKEILKKLNQSYPFAEDDLQRNVQKYLGPINKDILTRAMAALKQGDAETLGALMVEAQKAFDLHLMPACPSQFTAPVLHKVLNYEPIQPLIFGGKGVGSQGDGTAQFIAKDEASQEKLAHILEQDLGVECLKLTIGSAKKVRKAVIPAAGFGTGLFPASNAIKKELFPIIDKDGRAKPVVMAIIEEAVHAGIEEICLVVQENDRPIFESFFCNPLSLENFNKLSKENQEYSQYIMNLGSKLSFVYQKTQRGFGDAVYCAKDWVGNEPFLLMLGDHIYASDTELSCAQQLMDVYSGRSVVGLKETHESEIQHFGTVGGDWDENRQILMINEFAEKPNTEYARRHLGIKGLKEDQFLTLFGLYILTPKIFELLHDHIEHDIRDEGEIQLTPCLDQLRREEGFGGVVMQGRRFDIGDVADYREVIQEFGNVRSNS